MQEVADYGRPTVELLMSFEVRATAGLTVVQLQHEAKLRREDCVVHAETERK